MTTKSWRSTAPQLIYNAYPDSDLLPTEPPGADEDIASFKVRAEQAGDTLFLFLCREADEDCAGPDEFLHRLDRALNDIERVRQAVAGLAGPR